MSTNEWPVAVLSGSRGGDLLADAVREQGLATRRYRSFERLLRDPRLPSISVLVVDLDPSGCKTQLGAIGRIALEYPHIQIIGVIERAPSAVVGAYLTSCAVELIRGRLDASRAREIASFVSVVQERQSWSLEARPA